MNGTANRPDKSTRILPLIGTSFRLLFANFGILYPMAFAPAILADAAFLAVMPESEVTDPRAILTAGFFVVMALVSVLTYIMMALVILAANDRIEGRHSSLEDYVRSVFSNIVPILLSGTLLSIAIGVALLFFVLPGLYVTAQFVVWLPCILLERAGMGGLSRAQALTRGHRWPIVGALLVISVFIVAINLLGEPLIMLAYGAGGAATIFGALVSAAVQAFSYAIIAIFMTLTWRHLVALERG